MHSVEPMQENMALQQGAMIIILFYIFFGPWIPLIKASNATEKVCVSRHHAQEYSPTLFITLYMLYKYYNVPTIGSESVRYW